MAALLVAIRWVRWTSVVAAIAFLGTTGTAGLYSWNPSSARASLPTGRPECPQDSIHLPVHADQSTTTFVTRISVAPNIANVPEFNDCQAFVDGTGNKYLRDPKGEAALFAIFASETLDRLEFRLDSVAGNRRLPTNYTDIYGLSAAEIYSFEKDYPALGIKGGFNCLFLKRSFDSNGIATWHALMVAVGSAEPTCGSKFDSNPSVTTTTRLQVRVRPNPAGLSSTDVPAVARWDWDRERREHYIGIKCGRQWCEVGRDGFVASQFYAVSSPSPLFQRTRMIKGWYDEQRLAVQQGTGPAEVSPLRGTIYPDSAIDGLEGFGSSSPFTNHWLPAAYVQIHPDPTAAAAAAIYEARFNFAVTPDGTQMNLIYLCSGSAAECFSHYGMKPTSVAFVDKCEQQAQVLGDGPPWWARVVRGGVAPGYVTFKCVTRRAHGTKVPHIPGAARWRWMVEDEGTWMRCLQGCCEKN